MKKNKIILFIVFIIGVISLLILSSFISRSACEYANSNIEYIKNQMQEAVVANDFEMSKYYAYKAINGIEKTRLNFIDCGCQGTIESLEKALYYLKKGAKEPTLKDAKKYLHIALESTTIGINVLKEFEQDFSSPYGNNVLVLNTKDALEHQTDDPMPHGEHLRTHVHNCLLGFESSLDKVVNEVPCKEAQAFISKIHEEARLKLMNVGLSEPKKQYHQRVKTIAEDALLQLGDCSLD
ncbi:hypothetical protein [Flagellimonas eckloniae]|nr:hypothetical protein [Allomuricauda eckloniae]